MNNLTTRKIVLGMLMTFVLTFSVQGIADAYTVARKSSDDLEIRDIGDRDTFKVSFSVSGVDTADDSSDVLDIPAFTGLILEKIGTRTVISDHQKVEVTLKAVLGEDDEAYLLLKNTIYTLTYSVDSGASAGSETLVIPGGDSSDLDFTVYVVAEAARTTATVVVIGASDTPDGTVGIEYEVRGSQHELIHVNGAPNLPVTIKVSGGGRVYVREVEGNRETSETTSFTTSSDAPVYLNMKENTNKVTVTIPGLPSYTATYIYGNPRLERIGARDPKGIAGGRLAEPLGVRLVDFEGDEVSGIPVTFSGSGDGDDQFTYVPHKSQYKVRGEIQTATPTKPVNPTVGDDITVYTDSDGEAYAYYQFDPAAKTFQVVTVKGAPAIDAPAITTFEPEIEARDLRPTLHILSGDKQRTDEDGNLADPLVVVVRQDGRLKPGEQVTFRTSKGTLIGYTEASTEEDVETLDPTSGKRVYGKTDGSGEAEVTYFQDTGEGSDTVTATISGETSLSADYEKEVAFNVNGSGGSRPSGPSEPSNTITITLSETTGAPGEEIDVTVDSDPSAVVVIDSGDLDDADFSRLFRTTPFDITIVLPDEEGEYDFSAEAPGYTSDSATVTVEAELGTLSITAIGAPEAGLQTFSISAVDADGDRAIGTFTARLSGTGFTSRNVEISGGRGNARVTLPTAASLYTLTVSATGYEDGETPVRIAGTGQQQVADEDEEEVEEEVTVAAEPDSIEITGPSTRSGTVNEELDTPLLVRVLDDDGDGLEGARVFYRVSSGRGRLSARGNGRAIGVVTDDDGYARASFTPLDGGTITVRANTDDLSATVTFTITTGSASSASGARDSGTGGTPGMISPVVHVGAASRPPMLWVDGGAIYALVGASPQRFAPGVDNALNITVGGGKVYWTEKTGESGGTINSANLNGSDVTELTSIKAVPMGIAVDVAGSKLYWTNSRGRIQSADLDGSGITNVMQNLQSPMDLALAGGNAYWTQGNGSVRFVNLRGQKVVRNVSTGTDTPGSLVIGGGKVYWTEMTGESGGTVNSANLNGTGATQLASILAAPMGIAVDGSRSKLYWTNSRGRIQSANLDGSGITNVVSGLGSPGDMVLSNSISAPATRRQPQREPRRPPLISTMSMETDRSITPIVMQSQSQSQPGQPMPSTMSTETARLTSLTS